MELDCLISGEHDWQEEQAARANESCELLTHPEEAPVLLKAVAQVLLNAVEKAERVDRLTDNEDVDMATRLTPFHGAQPPAISLYDYLTRIARHAKMSPACFVVALMLIDEACTKEPALGPTQLTVHRLVLAALVLAAKSCEDETYKNGFLAKVGGIPLSELNAMELQLLLLLDFQLHKPPSATNAVVQALLTGTHQLGSRWHSTAPGHHTTDQLATACLEGPRAEGSSPASGLSTAPAPAQQGEATGLPLRVEQRDPASSPRAQSLSAPVQLQKNLQAPNGDRLDAVEQGGGHSGVAAGCAMLHSSSSHDQGGCQPLPLPLPLPPPGQQDFEAAAARGEGGSCRSPLGGIAMEAEQGHDLVALAAVEGDAAAHIRHCPAWGPRGVGRGGSLGAADGADVEGSGCKRRSLYEEGSESKRVMGAEGGEKVLD